VGYPPLYTLDTLSKASAPDKLPAIHCPPITGSFNLLGGNTSSVFSNTKDGISTTSSDKTGVLPVPPFGQKSAKENDSHLCCTWFKDKQCKGVVKVHGVFPSSCGYSASSRRIQFHWVYLGDSEFVVTPFMQDHN